MAVLSAIMAVPLVFGTACNIAFQLSLAVLLDQKANSEACTCVNVSPLPIASEPAVATT